MKWWDSNPPRSKPASGFQTDINEIAQNFQSSIGVPSDDTGSEPFSVETRKQNAGIPDPQAPSENPYTQSPEEQISIQQSNQLPFNVQILDPIAMAPTAINSSGFSQVLSSYLLNLLGRDPKYMTDWQSFELPLKGNFFKFEFLPAQHLGSSEILVSPGFGDQVNNSFPDESIFIGPNDGFSYNLEQRLVVIQFNNTSAPPLLIKPGQVYKGAYNTIFVTMGKNTPRMAFTGGFNVEITDSNTDQLLNQNLSLGGGRGLWDNPARHCTPFTFYTNTIPKGPAITGDQSIAVGAGVPSSTSLIKNLAASKGTMVGWVTNWSIYGDSGTVSFIAGALQIVNSATGLVQRTVCAMHAINGQLSGGDKIFSHIESFPEKRRFTLQPGEELQLNFFSAFAFTVLYAIHGYCYSLIIRNGPLGAPAAYRIAPPLLQHPFPDDALQQINGINGAP